MGANGISSGAQSMGRRSAFFAVASRWKKIQCKNNLYRKRTQRRSGFVLEIGGLRGQRFFAIRHFARGQMIY